MSKKVKGTQSWVVEIDYDFSALKKKQKMVVIDTVINMVENLSPEYPEAEVGGTIPSSFAISGVPEKVAWYVVYSMRVYLALRYNIFVSKKDVTVTEYVFEDDKTQKAKAWNVSIDHDFSGLDSRQSSILCNKMHTITQYLINAGFKWAAITGSVESSLTIFGVSKSTAWMIMYCVQSFLLDSFGIYIECKHISIERDEVM